MILGFGGNGGGGRVSRHERKEGCLNRDERASPSAPTTRKQRKRKLPNDALKVKTKRQTGESLCGPSSGGILIGKMSGASPTSLRHDCTNYLVLPWSTR